MTSDLEKDYNKFLKKYSNLPNFQALDKEFEIELNMGEKQIPPKFILRAISNATTNYIHYFVNYLHDLILPNPGSLIMMEESKIFNQEEKKKIEIILKKILYLTRKNVELVIQKSDKADADFIAELYTEWKVLKKQLLPLLQKAKNHWKS